MNKIFSALILLVSASSAEFVPSAFAETSQTATPKAETHLGSAELERIKSLAGRWKSTTSMFGTENEEVFTEYRVTAGGSAVIETIFPGTPYEMVSVYYDDEGGKLAMTHYCMLKNRPHFSLAKSEGNTIKLDVTKVEGLAEKGAPSMGAMTLVFEDADHFSSTCESGGEVKEGEPKSHTMRYSRVQ